MSKEDTWVRIPKLPYVLNLLRSKIALPNKKPKPKIKKSASHHLRHLAEVSARRGAKQKIKKIKMYFMFLNQSFF